MFLRKMRLPRAEFSKFARASVPRGAAAHGLGGRRWKQGALPYFFIKTKQNTVGNNRFGIVLASAVARKSTRRNFLKRRIRNVVAKWPKSPLDFLIIARPPASSHAREAFSCLAEFGKSLRGGK